MSKSQAASPHHQALACHPPCQLPSPYVTLYSSRIPQGASGRKSEGLRRDSPQEHEVSVCVWGQ